MNPKESKIVSMPIVDIKQYLETINTDQLICLIDDNILALYQNFFNQLGKVSRLSFIGVPAGESVKTLENFSIFIEKILETGIHRKTHLISIGGGATSDFVGLLASTLLRGLSWSCIPTTLLAMIDASIGGKVAINSKSGKNLIGGFHKPNHVIISTNFLATLPEVEKKSGLGELIKYGFLSRKIYDAIMQQESTEELISLCSRFKEDLTVRDFYETSERKSLNVGHTLGHAFEKLYRIPHGTAVLYGLKYEVIGYCKNNKMLSKLNEMCSKVGLKEPDFCFERKDVEPLVELCFKDKKLTNSKELEFLVPHDIEVIKSHIVKKEELSTLLKKLSTQ